MRDDENFNQASPMGLALLLAVVPSASIGMLALAQAHIPCLLDMYQVARVTLLARSATVRHGVHGGEVQVGREFIAVLNLADKQAQKRGDQFVSSEMVLLALTEDKSDGPASVRRPLRPSKARGLNRRKRSVRHP